MRERGLMLTESKLGWGLEREIENGGWIAREATALLNGNEWGGCVATTPFQNKQLDSSRELTMKLEAAASENSAFVLIQIDQFRPSDCWCTVRYLACLGVAAAEGPWVEVPGWFVWFVMGNLPLHSRCGQTSTLRP